jgi:hypothetical protein
MGRRGKREAVERGGKQEVDRRGPGNGGISTPRCGCARELAPTNPSARHTPATFPQIFFYYFSPPGRRGDAIGLELELESEYFFSRGLSAASSSIMESDRRREGCRSARCASRRGVAWVAAGWAWVLRANGGESDGESSSKLSRWDGLCGN